MWTQGKFRLLILSLPLVLFTTMVFFCDAGVSSAQPPLIISATAEGTTFTASSGGTYRFTITGGALQVCPPEAAPDHPEWWGWKTELLIYKNRPIIWSGGAHAPEHPSPADWDFSVGDQAFQPTYEQAEQIGTGMYVDIPLQANEYIILVVNDSQGYFWDNSGGVTLSVQPPLIIPATAEGTTFTANSGGTYRFTITGGAVQVCPPEAAPDHPEWWGWKTELLIYKNRPIIWSGGAQAPEHPSPADWDFSVGDQASQSTYEQAEQIGTGMYVDIPLQANGYIILVVNDSQGYFWDNSGGITLSVSLKKTHKALPWMMLLLD
jgi:hypothetical protein